MVSKDPRNNYFIPLLLSRIEAKFNNKVLYYSDCVALSSELAGLNISVSAHTLARLFKIVRSNTSPYKATLDLLVKYLDFDNFATFCAYETLASNISKPLKSEDAQSRIICFELFNNFFITGNENGVIKAQHLLIKDIVIDLYHHNFPVINIKIANDFLVYEDCNNSLFLLTIKEKLVF